MNSDSKDYKQLVVRANKARKKAYAIYSNFHVGAALLTKDGEIYEGCNIENGSYSATNCAERTAFFKAVSEGVREFEAIAIVADKPMTPPCGVCLQVMAEFCDRDTFQVILASETGEYQVYKLKELLPTPFSL